MVLNYIWVGFILIALLAACFKFVFLGDTYVFTDIINSTFDSAETGFNVSIGLTGILSMWLGLMKIGEKAGLIERFAKFSSPVFSKLFPELPKDHPVTGSIFMNFSANLLGLDNAATPIGLKAMEQLQELNSKKDTASNTMIMFLCINASGLTIVPITIIMYRARFEAANPADVFLPILITTFIATFVAIITVCLIQKINIFQKNLILFFIGIVLFISGIMWIFNSLEQERISQYSTLFANALLFLIICSFIISGILKKINVYDAFIVGAKEGFYTAVKIIPYLIAILLSIGIFRASGAMDFLLDSLRSFILFLGFDARFVEAIPTIIMKPLSGSGSRGLMIDAMKTFGADSFAGRLSCIVQGSVDTAFYVVAVYYGSVAIRNTRYTIPCALAADCAGAIAAIFMTYLFFSDSI